MDLLLVFRLFDVVHTDHKLTLVFEYLDQDLKIYLDQCEGPMDLRVLKSFLFQLLRGIAYCHHHRVLHRLVLPCFRFFPPFHYGFRLLQGLEAPKPFD